jgi:hypothetical protein
MLHLWQTLHDALCSGYFQAVRAVRGLFNSAAIGFELGTFGFVSSGANSLSILYHGVLTGPLPRQDPEVGPHVAPNAVSSGVSS